MKKTNLKNGDIIVNREGYLGIVILDEERIIYQFNGSDYLFDFNEDLTLIDDQYSNGDIMEIYRGTDFYEVNLNQEKPLYQRDTSWQRPIKK